MKKSVKFVGGLVLLIAIAGVAGYILRPQAPCPPTAADQPPPVMGGAPGAPVNTDMKFEQANKLVNAREFDKAIVVLKDLLEKDKTNSPMQMTKLAQCYLETKNLAEAERYLKEAEAIDNKLGFIYLTYAGLYEAKNDYSKAKESLNKSLELATNDPDRIATYMQLARLAERQKDIKGAKENLAKVFKIDSKDPQATEMKDRLDQAAK